MNGKSDDPKAGTKIVSERQLREAAKAALRKADRFGGSRKKPPARVTKNTAQNRRWMPPNSPLIKRAKPTSFGQRDMKNIALRLRGEAD